MKNKDFIEAVNIIAKYIPEEEMDKDGVYAKEEHIFFGADEWVTDEKDRQRLDELDWFINEESWSSFT